MHVLVIDDEVELAAAIAEGLQADGFSVDVRHDGEAGFAAAQAGAYDAIVLDLMMPKMNGYKVCGELRAAGVATPILMLTAKSGEYDIEEGLETGADDYLTKPFSLIVLKARLRALQRRVQTLEVNELHCGSLSLDVDQRRCTRRGTDIKLTAREAAVLEVLLRADGKTVSKADLTRTVWGDGSDENVAEVYIGYLRRKLDTPFDLSSIETVRGVGYRLSCTE